MQILRNNMPAIAGGAIFLAALFAMTAATVGANDGRLIYTLDDPYIHMAIARNLAHHGVFGVTRFAFSSSTSSPLWTLLLALCYRLLGVSDWWPGLLATLFALAALWATNALALRLGIGAWGRFFVVLSVAYFSPLISLVSTGMEHSMHVFLVIALVSAIASYTLTPKPKTRALLCLLGFLAVGARYESAFLVAPLSLLLLIRKEWRCAVALSAAALLPIILYGVFSHLHGAYFLPNSVMMKGHFPQVSGFRSLVMELGYRGFGRLTGSAHLNAIGVLLLLGAAKRSQSGLLRLLGLAMVCSIILHLQFASIGWFHRYDAYLVALSLPLIAGLHLRGISPTQARLRSSQPVLSTMALLACTVLLIWPLHHRARKGLERVVRMSNHIYRQQYHMADFVNQMYPSGVRVALNDLGAVSYSADADILDLWGIGSIEVTRAMRKHEYDTGTIQALLADRQVDVVMVYSNWFTDDMALPDNLLPVADWTTTGNYFGKTVSFYALSADAADDLETRLRHYQGHLPDSVDVEYTRTGQTESAAPSEAAPGAPPDGR